MRARWIVTTGKKMLSPSPRIGGSFYFSFYLILFYFFFYCRPGFPSGRRDMTTHTRRNHRYKPKYCVTRTILAEDIRCRRVRVHILYVYVYGFRTQRIEHTRTQWGEYGEKKPFALRVCIFLVSDTVATTTIRFLEGTGKKNLRGADRLKGLKGVKKRRFARTVPRVTPISVFYLFIFFSLFLSVYKYP